MNKVMLEYIKQQGLLLEKEVFDFLSYISDLDLIGSLRYLQEMERKNSKVNPKIISTTDLYVFWLTRNK